jgi:hypothetical protein
MWATRGPTLDSGLRRNQITRDTQPAAADNGQTRKSDIDKRTIIERIGYERKGYTCDNGFLKDLPSLANVSKNQVSSIRKIGPGMRLVLYSRSAELDQN